MNDETTPLRREPLVGKREDDAVFEEVVQDWYESFGPPAETVTKNWAPTRDGLTCNLCRKPVHYESELYVHVHDDPVAATCVASQNHGRVRRARLDMRDLERMRFAYDAGIERDQEKRGCCHD